jgi:hypothetical protein
MELQGNPIDPVGVPPRVNTTSLLPSGQGRIPRTRTDIDILGRIRWIPGMARLARLVVPGLPHHITQRGNGRQQTFLRDDDYAAYVELMAEWCGERGVEVWAYCLISIQSTRYGVSTTFS